MMNYNLNSYVSKKESEALKEIIFNRVRERSESMNAEVQTDIMDVARESFVSKNNPFSQIVQGMQETAERVENVEKSAQEYKKEVGTNQAGVGIGFPQRVEKAYALEQNRLIQEQMTVLAIQNNMNEAREALSNKKSFMGALNFLNTQGAVSLMRTRADRFEVLS